MRTCSKCGTSCSPKARFCIKCRNPLRQTNKQQTCARGHRMDPSWQACPFCESTKLPEANPLMARPARPERVRTMVEIEPDTQTTPPVPPELPAVKDRYATVVAVEPIQTPPQKTETKPRPKQPPRAQPPSRAKTQVILSGKPPKSKGAILAVLVSYSHNPDGVAFLIRSGRNVLGSSDSAAIRAKDPSISEKHAVIGADEQQIYIDDCLSTNGTFVNDVAIEEKFRLSHGDLIRTGNTLWHFARIEAGPKRNH